MKTYIKPEMAESRFTGGLPTVMAMFAASAAAGAAAVAASKLVGDDKPRRSPTMKAVED